MSVANLLYLSIIESNGEHAAKVAHIGFKKVGVEKECFSPCLISDCGDP